MSYLKASYSLKSKKSSHQNNSIKFFWRKLKASKKILILMAFFLTLNSMFYYIRIFMLLLITLLINSPTYSILFYLIIRLHVKQQSFLVIWHGETIKKPIHEQQQIFSRRVCGFRRKQVNKCAAFVFEDYLGQHKFIIFRYAFRFFIIFMNANRILLHFLWLVYLSFMFISSFL